MYQLNAIVATALFGVGWLSTLSLSLDSGRNFAVQVGTVANASQLQPLRWSPEKGRGSVGGTLSGGRRGVGATCHVTPGRLAPKMTLLVPGNAQGLTTSKTPTLHWYVETQKPVEMSFVLQHPNEATPIYTQNIQLERSGLVNVTLSGDRPLETGTRYRWSVFLACSNGEAGEMVARSFIERIERADLMQQVKGRSLLEQGAIFASAGIWYDAISRLVTAYQQTPQNSEIRTGLKSLLQQAGVNNIGDV